MEEETLMRFVFVTEVNSGGSLRSQRELALELIEIGHEVHLLMETPNRARLRRWLYQQLLDLNVRLEGSRWRASISWLMQRVDTRLHWTTLEGFPCASATIVPNAIPRFLAEVEPDFVVASSVSRPSWRLLRSKCADLGLPTVLYVREATSLDHAHFGEVPDLFMVNSRGLEEDLRQRGFDCVYVPSVVDVSKTLTTSLRRTALMINPIRERRVDVVLALAERLPGIPFALQESWLMSREQFDDLSKRTSHLANVEVRRAQQPGPTLFGDARVLIAPYDDGHRPRVVAEAQANGIPIIGLNTVGLRDAIGPGGVVVSGNDIEEWVRALEECWKDEDHYETLRHHALENSSRLENQPRRIAESFARIVQSLSRVEPDS